MKKRQTEQVLMTPTLSFLSRTWFSGFLAFSREEREYRAEACSVDLIIYFSKSYLLVSLKFFRVRRQRVGCVGRARMRFWDKDVDRWRRIGIGIGV